MSNRSDISNMFHCKYIYISPSDNIQSKYARATTSQLYLLKSVLCIDDIERKNTESKVWYGLQRCINSHYAWITLSNFCFCFFKVTCPSKICFALLEVFSCHTAFFFKVFQVFKSFCGIACTIHRIKSDYIKLFTLFPTPEQ